MFNLSSKACSVSTKLLPLITKSASSPRRFNLPAEAVVLVAHGLPPPPLPAVYVYPEPLLSPLEEIVVLAYLGVTVNDVGV